MTGFGSADADPTVGFRAVDLDDPALGQTADPQRDVETKGTGRGRLDILDRVLAAQLHDRTLAELPFDLGQGAVQRLLLVRVALAVHTEKICRCHSLAPYSTRTAARQSLLSFASCS
ncbi:hypothetical protein SSE37_00935, partial [Sagittula stellata E-37]